MGTTSMEERKGKEGVLGRGSGVVITSQTDPMRVLKQGWSFKGVLRYDKGMCLYALMLVSPKERALPW